MTQACAPILRIKSSHELFHYDKSELVLQRDHEMPPTEECLSKEFFRGKDVLDSSFVLMLHYHPMCCNNSVPSLIFTLNFPLTEKFNFELTYVLEQ